MKFETQSFSFILRLFSHFGTNIWAFKLIRLIFNERTNKRKLFTRFLTFSLKWRKNQSKSIKIKKEMNKNRKKDIVLIHVETELEMERERQ